jgi:hypothetical protein
MQKFDRTKNKLYLDMDGVLVDFNKFVFDRMGKIFPQNSKMDDSTMWKYLDTIDHLFLKLEPMPYAYRLYKEAALVADNVEILTAIPRRGQAPTAREDKVAWVKKHFGDHLKVNFGPYSKDKWKHCVPGDILIDDRHDNIIEWDASGGNGILHFPNDYDRTVKLLHDIVNSQ